MLSSLTNVLTQIKKNEHMIDNYLSSICYEGCFFIFDYKEVNGNLLESLN